MRRILSLRAVSCGPGDVRAAHSSTRDGILKLVDPSNEEVIGDVPEDNTDQIHQKGARALHAFHDWSAAGYPARRAVLSKFGALLRSKAGELAQLVTRETGKPLAQATAEVRGGAQRVAQLLALADQLPLETDVSLAAASAPSPAAAVASPGPRTSGRREMVSWQPAGVIADISTWNYPVTLAINVSAAALLLGNTVLYKPSEHAALTGQAISRLLHEAGVPKEAHIVCTGGAATAASVALVPALAGLAFTGSHAAGTQLASVAARRCVPAVLELGGKDKVYVHSDVGDLRHVAATISDAAYVNGGQTCCAPRLVFAHEAVADELALRLEDRVCGYKIGDPAEASTFMGPLISRAAVQMMADAVSDALHRGGHKLFAGRQLRQHSLPAKGFWCQPVLLSLVKSNWSAMRWVREEGPFGPLLAVLPVTDWREAAQHMAADERFGLTAAVFSADEDVAMRVFKKLGGSVGTVYWNACGEMAATLPWSGRKQSGMGCTSGAHGLYSFLRPRSMVLRSPPVAGPLEKHPRLHGAAPLHDRHTGQQPRRAHRSDDYTITTHHRDDHNKEEDPGRR